MTEVKPLTIENWTPDIVASILGTLIGTYLGLFFLALELLIPATSVRAFSLLIILMVAYAFNRIVFHMELDGRRHFQQAFSLIIPTTLLFFTLSLLGNTVIAQVKNMLNTIVEKFNPLNLLGAPATTHEAASFSLHYQEPLIWTAVLTLALLLPFLIHAIRTKQFRITWLLYLLIPIALCGLVAVIGIGIVTAIGIF